MKMIRSGTGMIGLGLALTFLGASAAEAINVTFVSVSVGAAVFNSANVGWTFPVTLSGGQDLVLTQDLRTGPTNDTSYNFDTSDPPAVLGLLPTITITVDGITTTFTDSFQVLNTKSQGSVALELNEAQNYGAALAGPAGLGYQVFLGYADNVHINPCGVYATSLGLLGSSTCLPSPFSAATVFEGTGGVDPGVAIQINPNHCGPGAPTCYDAGVIRIVANPVPEPATVMLLLTGLAGLVVQRCRRRPGRAHADASPHTD
jgi:hypothetical protein